MKIEDVPKLNFRTHRYLKRTLKELSRIRDEQEKQLESQDEKVLTKNS